MALAQPTNGSEKSELAAAIAQLRGSFIKVALFSGVINVLMLTGAFFMLQVYDRVLPSRSVPTLIALALLTAGLFATLALLDMIRSRILVRIGLSLDESLSARLYKIVVRLPLRVGHKNDGMQPLRDLDSVRGFLSSTGPTALFDLPWMPLYLGIIYAFHPALGITALVGAILLIILTVVTDGLARRPMRDASQVGLTRFGLAEAGRRNTEVLTVLGMVDRFTGRWEAANRTFLDRHRQASDVTGSFSSVTKALRMLLQSAVLGIGAYLVIIQAATAGIIIAATILTARALAPIDIAIANWKGFIGARQSWHRLKGILGALPVEAEPMALPAPTVSLTVEHASVVPPGGKKPVLQDIDFKLERGQGLGIIGPSASGKSSLARMMVGAWQPLQGKVCLDNASLDQWSSESLGRYIGYMPQDVELFAGSVAENISRFEPNADAEAIVKAAKAANVHDMILAFPNGYETDIGEQGEVLSAGQRQRVALARALYGDPFLVVLDEPNSNLDTDGEIALTQAILGVRRRGGIVVVVAHRPSAVAGVDLILVMAQGRLVNFGSKEKVLAELRAKKPAMTKPPLAVVPAGETR
ncbi:MAG: type I secretion system permease/ATPase [Hyphomicrobiaceae bacterium]